MVFQLKLKLKMRKKVCKTCHGELIYTGGTANLFYHIKRQVFPKIGSKFCWWNFISARLYVCMYVCIAVCNTDKKRLLLKMLLKLKIFHDLLLF
jgi:hypothetical protein